MRQGPLTGRPGGEAPGAGGRGGLRFSLAVDWPYTYHAAVGFCAGEGLPLGTDRRMTDVGSSPKRTDVFCRADGQGQPTARSKSLDSV